MRAPTYTDRQVRKIMKKNKFEPVRQCGSHVIYRNSEGTIIPIPQFKPNKMLVRRMIRQYNLIV